MTPVHTKLHLLQQEGFGRDIYIEPVLVNSEDGTEPQTRPKHVRV